MFKRHLPVVLIVLAVALAACGGGQTATDPLSVFEAHIEARNAYDLDGALSMVADDAVFDTPFGQYTGKEEITVFLEDTFASEFQTTLEEPTVEGDTLTVIENVTREREIPNELESETVIVDGKITSYTLDYTCSPVIPGC